MISIFFFILLSHFNFLLLIVKRYPIHSVHLKLKSQNNFFEGLSIFIDTFITLLLYQISVSYFYSHTVPHHLKTERSH